MAGVAIGAVVLTACGSTGPNRSVTGSWQGTLAATGLFCNVWEFQLDQQGQDITGSWVQAQCSNGAAGATLAQGTNLSGTNVGDSVTIMFGGTGYFGGRLDASGDTLRGSLMSSGFFMTRQ
jgi:hypothetical protein